MFALDVQPIPPSQVVDAINKTGESAIKVGQGISEPFAVYLVMAAGVIIVVGLVLAALGITKRVLATGALALFGTAIMFVLTHQPVEVVGILKGAVMSFFSHLSAGG
ncbi:MAG: hypothetical protein K6T65_07920 [Peptococcaceae bacterium]|nr:hypothetical protein [Peptococcaceae bacterium]